MRQPFSLRVLTAAALLAGVAAVAACLPGQAQDLPPKLREAEAKRVAAVAKVKPAVCAIFAKGGQGGGSGVLISEDGYALSNFHVVGGMRTMQVGLPDGVLYDAVIVGTDKVGDVGLIKLMPKKEGQKFPFAKMGDSDKLKAGDWSLAMGNPFLLATDFTPTVTYGLISGVHRYQYPEGKGLLEYTDCIQIDTSINPGNSGGPLFNLDGELVGINGRGSFDKRNRINSGVGYAISINQIKNFMGHLKVGLDADHASLGALVRSDSEDGANARMIVSNVLEESDAFRRGLNVGDEVVSFGGRPLGSVNQFKNVLGLYPRGWRMPLVYRTRNDKKELETRQSLVRLMGAIRQEIKDPDQPGPKPGPRPVPVPAGPPSPAAKFYKAKEGFANYYFNEQERNRMLAGFKKHGDFTGLKGAWVLEGTCETKGRSEPFKFLVKEEEDKKTKAKKLVATFEKGGIPFTIEPLKKQDIKELKVPESSGGLVFALFSWWQLLTLGQKGFEGDFSHGGTEPFYPPPADGIVADWAKLRMDAEVLRTEVLGVRGKWYFSPKDQALLGFESSLEREEDPCEVYLFDYKKVDGRELPHRIEVRYGNGPYTTINVKKYDIAAK